MDYAAKVAANKRLSGGAISLFKLAGENLRKSTLLPLAHCDRDSILGIDAQKYPTNSEACFRNG